jgi:hypothetical protein
MRLDKKFLARLLGIPEEEIGDIKGMTFELKNARGSRAGDLYRGVVGRAAGRHDSRRDQPGRAAPASHQRGSGAVALRRVPPSPPAEIRGPARRGIPRFPLTYPTSLWRPVRAIADRKATAMSAGTECSSGIHATAVSASCSLKGRPVSAEQRPAATNPVSGRGLGGQPGGSNTTDLAENEFGLLAAIVSLLREFGAARSIVCNRWCRHERLGTLSAL